ncbi:hypothetical protein JCM9279_002497 [Rhodotorula babjevae]
MALPPNPGDRATPSPPTPPTTPHRLATLSLNSLPSTPSWYSKRGYKVATASPLPHAPTHAQPARQPPASAPFASLAAAASPTSTTGQPTTSGLEYIWDGGQGSDAHELPDSHQPRHNFAGLPTASSSAQPATAPQQTARADPVPPSLADSRSATKPAARPPSTVDTSYPSATADDATTAAAARASLHTTHNRPPVPPPPRPLNHGTSAADPAQLSPEPAHAEDTRTTPSSLESPRLGEAQQLGGHSSRTASSTAIGAPYSAGAFFSHAATASTTPVSSVAGGPQPAAGLPARPPTTLPPLKSLSAPHLAQLCADLIDECHAGQIEGALPSELNDVLDWRGAQEGLILLVPWMRLMILREMGMFPGEYALFPIIAFETGRKPHADLPTHRALPYSTSFRYLLTEKVIERSSALFAIGIRGIGYDLVSHYADFLLRFHPSTFIYCTEAGGTAKALKLSPSKLRTAIKNLLERNGIQLDDPEASAKRAQTAYDYVLAFRSEAELLKKDLHQFNEEDTAVEMGVAYFTRVLRSIATRAAAASGRDKRFPELSAGSASASAGKTRGEKAPRRDVKNLGTSIPQQPTPKGPTSSLAQLTSMPAPAAPTAARKCNGCGSSEGLRADRDWCGGCMRDKAHTRDSSDKPVEKRRPAFEPDFDFDGEIPEKLEKTSAKKLEKVLKDKLSAAALKAGVKIKPWDFRRAKGKVDIVGWPIKKLSMQGAGERKGNLCAIIVMLDHGDIYCRKTDQGDADSNSSSGSDDDNDDATPSSTASESDDDAPAAPRAFASSFPSPSSTASQSPTARSSRFTKHKGKRVIHSSGSSESDIGGSSAPGGAKTATSSTAGSGYKGGARKKQITQWYSSSEEEGATSAPAGGRVPGVVKAAAAVAAAASGAPQAMPQPEAGSQKVQMHD